MGGIEVSVELCAEGVAIFLLFSDQDRLEGKDQSWVSRGRGR